MELRIYDEQIEHLGAVDEIDSLIWKIMYFDVGTFRLLAPITENNKKLLIEGNIVVKHDDKHEIADGEGNTWRRAAQITYKHISKNEKGMEQIEAQGYMLSRWLNKRCIEPQIVMTGSNQRIINKMVRDNCGDGAGAKRRFPRFIMMDQESQENGEVEYANQIYAKLGSEVKARAQAGKLGYDILINEKEGRYGFYLYKGRDFTAKNSKGNTPCIFSRDFDNVNEQEYIASIENYGNFIYVQGMADGNGIQPVVTVDGAGASGLELTEVYCEATDITRKYKENGIEYEIPIESYLQMLATRGSAELETYGEVVNFTSTINADSNLVFKKDFDVGDRVTCKEVSWGIQIDVRITEATETYQKGVEKIEITFGESLPTLADQIRKVR